MCNGVRVTRLVITMLTSRYCQDPYRELELYLEQAQEEIGKAFETLTKNHLDIEPQSLPRRRSSSPLPFSCDFSQNIPVRRKLSSPNIFTNSNCDNKIAIEHILVNGESETNCSCVLGKLQHEEEKNEKEKDNLPRPPSGNIELLTEWVDTFVEAINTSLNADDIEINEDSSQDNSELQHFGSIKCEKTSSISRPLYIPIANKNSELNGRTFITQKHIVNNVNDTDFQRDKNSDDCLQGNVDKLYKSKTAINSKNLKQLENNADGQDAITQTTPQLSRSSSITGVTECSEEVESISSSEDSVPRFSSSSSAEFQTAESSSSLSSEEEIRLERFPQKFFQKEQSRTVSGTPSRNFHSENCSVREIHSEVCLALEENLKKCNKNGRLFIKELNLKSSSAPLLEVKFSASSPNSPIGNSDFTAKLCDACKQIGDRKVTVPARSHSVQELTELEALEACSWLRATGFPQYAQMYEDNLFPIDISSVKKDHEFLDTDSIQSLFRRLNTLNKCARMKIDNVPRKSFLPDDSDDDDFCALSENWQFQRSSRRWSRVPPPLLNSNNSSNTSKYCIQSPTKKFLSSDDVYSSSHDSVFIEDQQSSPDSLRKVLSIHYEEDMYIPSSPVPMEEDIRASGSGSGSSPSFGSDVTLEKQSELLDISRGLRRTGSERLRDSARALLRRMESLRGKRKKKNRHAVIIAGTQNINDSTSEDQSQTSISASPQLIHHTFLRNYPSDDIGQGDDSDCSQCSTPQFKHRKRGWRILNRSDMDSVVHSDSECPNSTVNYHWKDANSNDTHLNHHGVHNSTSKHSEEIHKTTPEAQKLSKRENYLTPQNAEKEDRLSVYDNVPAPLAIFDDAFDQQDDPESIENGSDERNGTTLNIRTEDVGSGSIGSSMACNSDKDIADQQDSNGFRERRDSGVGLSLTRSSNNDQSWWHCFPHRQSSVGIRQSFSSGLQLNSLSAPQLMVLRKLSLLKLTTLMEKYSPSSRSGWNWAVPKFIRKMRTPDYKDKVVFGVPLLLVLQRSGQPLPSVIETAIRHLQKTSLNCTGLFRKSGVRSRIQKLRNLNETNPDSSVYENQQAYDIADMLKQYFRELPEALLTNKLSEIFLTIFQHIPEELRREATQAAILLMPDENREVLQSLLAFLQEVSFHSEENQMTATNLAVCFAPSLFHLNTPRSASASPRRSKTVGVPDQRELNENRAAHECLTHMIKEYKSLFTVSEDTLGQCRSLYLEEWEPATLEDLGKTSFRNDENWKAYVDNCIQGLLKEAREKFKGWIPVPQSEADIAYKKLTDRHPLRLWKVSTEVEAPPIELLNRILRERHIWDDSLLKWRVVSRLDKQSEIFQYVCASLLPHPPRDYCVLRSWQTDLPKGTCVLIETSVEHSEAPMMLGGVRGVALASHYLIEPCGSGKSRVTYISRIDTRGRTPEWYNKAYGQLCALKINRLKNSFTHGTDGPETKV